MVTPLSGNTNTVPPPASRIYISELVGINISESVDNVTWHPPALVKRFHVLASPMPGSQVWVGMVCTVETIGGARQAVTGVPPPPAVMTVRTSLILPPGGSTSDGTVIIGANTSCPMPSVWYGSKTEPLV